MGKRPRDDSGLESTSVTEEQPDRYRLGSRRKEGVAAEDAPTMLGFGGAGQVLIAFDRHLGREIAVKQLMASMEECRDPEASDKSLSFAQARFLREARVTAQLDHPNIVPVYELGRRRDGSLYYTMKLVRGMSLDEALAQCNTLDERLEYLSHFIALCQAVAYAHSRGVIHRDIKPGNVMVGAFGETVLLDWGVAKVRGEEELAKEARVLHTQSLRVDDTFKTLDGVTLGTPSYMSPEQARGKLEEIDERSDTWGLGAVLYRILGGRAPFCGDSRAVVLQKVANGDITPLNSLCPEAPTELVAVAEKAMRLEKEDRYQTASEMARDIEAHRKGLRVGAYAYSAWELFRKFAAKKKGLLGALAALMAVLLIALASISVAYERETDARQLAEKRHRIAEQRHADMLRESARAAMLRGELVEARAKVRQSLEVHDSYAARALWWQIARQPLAWRKKLGSYVYGVTFSNDGSRLAAGCQDKSIHLFDTRTLASRFLRGHADQVFYLVFSHDDRRLASCEWNGTVRLWNLEQGTSQVLPGRLKEIWNLSFSPDDRYLAAGGAEALHIWEVRTGRLARHIALEHQAWEVRFSRDGELVWAGCEDGTTRAWRVDSGVQARSLPGHDKRVRSISISPDGKTMVTGSYDRTVAIRDLESGRIIERIQAHDSAVLHALFSPDGTRLATNGAEHVVRVWNTRTWQLEREMRHASKTISSIAFSPDSRLLAGGGHDKTIFVWNLEADPGRQRPVGHVALVYGTAFSPDGRRLASASVDGTVRVWDVKTGVVTRRLACKPQGFGVRFSPDGKMLAASCGKVVRLWDAESGAPIRTLEGHTLGATNIAFGPKGRLLAAGSYDSCMRVWNVANGKQVLVDKGHKKSVYGVAFSPDGRLVATGGFDKTVRVIDLASGRLVHSLKEHKSPVFNVVFSTDGRRIYTANEDGTVRVWDLASRKSRVLKRFDGRVYALALHPASGRLAASTSSGMAWILGLEDERVVRLAGHQGEVNCIALSPDGWLAATASDDNTVRVWNADSGSPYWRSPVLLRDGAEILTHQGWKLLQPGGQESRKPDAAWRRLIETRARFVPDPGDETVMCIHASGQRLIGWDTVEDEKLFERHLPGLQDVMTAAGGCLTRSKDPDTPGRVEHHDREGASTLVASGASAIGADGENILLAAGDEVIVWHPDTGRKETFPGKIGVSALARVAGRLVLGNQDGNIELVREADTSTYAFTFEDVPASPVVRMLPGPSATLIAGYANGLVGIWDLKDGTRLMHARLHGPVVHIQLARGRLHVATELGDHLSFDLGVFEQSYCSLMRTIWERVPVVWQDGLLVVREPPTDHACSATRDAGRTGG